MNTIYITINHLEDFCTGNIPRPGTEVILKKDPDNPYDDEAIIVKKECDMRIGYVANSVDTVARGTYSAGRLYDRIGDVAKAVIRFVVGDAAIAELLCTQNSPVHKP